LSSTSSRITQANHLIGSSFVAFVAGSFAAVLLLASVIDPDLIVHFEVTPHRTVLFYIGVFGSVLAVARGMIPDENRVFDPEMLMMEVIQYTHYMPDEWKGQLHSKQVFLRQFHYQLQKFTVFKGSSRIREIVCDESHDFRPGTYFCRIDAFCPLALTASLCPAHH
jgi:hypothetical protein